MVVITMKFDSGSNTMGIHDIDYMLSRSHLFLLQYFHYYPGDCVFDSFFVLLHFHYTSTEICKSIVSHIHFFLSHHDPRALESMCIELLVESIKQLHDVDYLETYLQGLSTSYAHCSSMCSLWGDPFCIKWFSICLSILVNVCLYTNGKCYISFNLEIDQYQYNILFHNQNSICGHFEPLLSY